MPESPKFRRSNAPRTDLTVNLLELPFEGWVQGPRGFNITHVFEPLIQSPDRSERTEVRMQLWRSNLDPQCHVFAWICQDSMVLTQASFQTGERAKKLVKSHNDELEMLVQRCLLSHGAKNASLDAAIRREQQCVSVSFVDPTGIDQRNFKDFS